MDISEDNIELTPNKLLINIRIRNLKDLRQVCTSIQDTKLNAMKLSNMWGIGIERAKTTIQLTTYSTVPGVMQLPTIIFKTKSALFQR